MGDVPGIPVVLVISLVLAGTVAGCGVGGGRVADCVPPANEAALLDEYASDPVLAVAPAGATRREEPRRVSACYRLNNLTNEISRTTVHVEYDLARDPDQAEVRALLEPAITQAGWTPVEDRLTDLGGMLRYCRTVQGEPSGLDVIWQRAIDPGDEEPTVPGVLALIVHTSAGVDDPGGCPT